MYGKKIRATAIRRQTTSTTRYATIHGSRKQRSSTALLGAVPTNKMDRRGFEALRQSRLRLPAAPAIQIKCVPLKQPNKLRWKKKSVPASAVVFTVLGVLLALLIFFRSRLLVSQTFFLTSRSNMPFPTSWVEKKTTPSMHLTIRTATSSLRD